jgi:hypothetical protein
MMHRAIGRPDPNSSRLPLCYRSVRALSALGRELHSSSGLDIYADIYPTLALQWFHFRVSLPYFSAAPVTWRGTSLLSITNPFDCAEEKPPTESLSHVH